jgi:hypothetical protein
MRNCSSDVAFFACVTIAVTACSSGTSTNPTSNDASTADAPTGAADGSGATRDALGGETDAAVEAGSCGMVFYGSDYAASCQAALDAACCSQEQACAANADCAKLVACINACPSPRQDACVNACAADAGTNPPGYTQLNDIASCTKTPAYQGPPGVCDWPSGNGH